MKISDLYCSTYNRPFLKNQSLAKHWRKFIEKNINTKSVGNNSFGRWYDYILTFIFMQENKLLKKGIITVDLAACGCYFGALMTQWGRSYVSDNFKWYSETKKVQSQNWYSVAIKPDNLTRDIMDAENLYFPDNFADIVSCYSALEHFRNDTDILALKEMRRILKPCGHIFISIEINPEKYNCGYYTSDRFLKAVKEAGLDFIQSPNVSNVNIENIILHKRVKMGIFMSGFYILRKK